MPTFREDLHLGHEVATTDTDDIVNGAITEEKMADGSVSTRIIQDGAVTEPKLDDGAVSTRIIQEGAVTTPKIKDKNVTPEKVSDDFVDTLLQPLIDALEEKHDEDVHRLTNKDADLQNQIDSLEIAGVAVSNEFGSDPHISISQKTLTDAFDKIWQKLEDITGEVIQGFNMVVTPTYFVSEEGCTIHVSASTASTNGIFERIQFFIDGELIHEETNTEYVSFDYILGIKETNDYVIMCKAKVMGIEYTRQQTITRYNEFFIGAGATYTDIMDSEHARQLDGRMRHSYDITFGDGDKLIIVMGASLRERFIRADLNGVEIHLNEETVTIDGKDYAVFTSDSWSAGEYNIDING